MRTLGEVRADIDALDARLAPLVAARMRLADEVAAAKRAAKVSVNDPNREREILGRVAAAVGSEEAEDARSAYAAIFEISKRRQRRNLAAAKAGGAKPRIAVVGMGLIGGSFHKASLAAGYETAGLHHGESAGLAAADIVMVCLPPEAIVPWIRGHAGDFRRGAVVVDICGMKRGIVAEMREVPRDGWTFVGGHPMAGREVSGYANSKGDLFVGASMILTPAEEVPEATVAALKEYFAAVGFHETVVTTPERHDDMIAFTSQLCHVIATTYARDPRVRDAVGFSAGSYANMTRIATQDAPTWRALYDGNRDRLVPVLDAFAERFRELSEAIRKGDAAAVERMIAEGTAAKRQELIERERGDER